MTNVSHILAYLGIFMSAAVEGEVVYSSAVVAAQLGYLNPLGVLLCGAAGGSAGDQFFFYLLRTGITRLDRFPMILRRREQIKSRVQSHAVAMILSSRFLPGLRIAISAACAYAGISPIQFTSFSLISGLAWAGAIMLLIGQIGSGSLAQLGLKAWWVPIIPALFVIAFFRWLARTITGPS